MLNRLFQLNRRVFKAYMLKESLERLWDYRYERAMVNYLGKWTDQLRWQRLPSFQKLAAMSIKHLDGILNYCRTKVRFGGGRGGQREYRELAAKEIIQRLLLALPAKPHRLRRFQMAHYREKLALLAPVDFVDPHLSQRWLE